eukprot:1255895-Rhodomonas_salina.1
MPGMDDMWGMGGMGYGSPPEYCVLWVYAATRQREMWMMYDRFREMYERGTRALGPYSVSGADVA